MKPLNWKSWVVGGMLSFLAFIPSQSFAISTPVDLELQLLVDVSGSVSTSEFNLQRSGYVSAFQDPTIQSAITNGSIGAIAVQLIYWSSTGTQAIGVDWTLINDTTTANAFATAVGAAARPFGGGTDPQSAMSFGAPLFASNNFDGTRLVADVSGDGTGPLNTVGRDAMVAAGVTVNGLVISPTTSLTNYYNNYIVSTGGFLVTAANFTDFENAVKTKIGREITGGNPIPEPSTVILFGSGLAGLAAWRMRKANKA